MVVAYIALILSFINSAIIGFFTYSVAKNIARKTKGRR